MTDGTVAPAVGATSGAAARPSAREALRRSATGHAARAPPAGPAPSGRSRDQLAAPASIDPPVGAGTSAASSTPLASATMRVMSAMITEMSKSLGV